MPEPSRFDNLNEYRQTLIHEAAHAAGHPGRMGRWTEAETRRAEPGYRLVRNEMAAMVLGHALGLGNDP